MVMYAFLGVLCTIAQQVMAPLPNIEPVSLLVMLYAVCFGMESLWAVYVYVFLEYLLYGFNLWSLSYLYVWAILFLIAWKLRSVESVVSFALLSGVFGLAFGALVHWSILFFSAGSPHYPGGWRVLPLTGCMH